MRNAVVAAAAWGLCCVALGLAQGGGGSQFRSRTDLVVIDVSVLDQTRKPARALTARDFRVFNDGVEQEISAFQAVEVPAADVPTAKWMTRATLDVQSNTIPGGRLILILMDERARVADPFFAQAAKTVGHALVDQLATDDVAAVAYALDHRNVQEFTTDRGRLHQAIDAFAAAPYLGPENSSVSVVRTMRDLAAYLGAIPERRKILAYVGSGEPFSLEALTFMELSTLKPLPLGATPTNVIEGMARLRSDEQRTEVKGLLDLAGLAQTSNVTIYAFDPMGLTPGLPGDSIAPELEAQRDLLRILAATTGGRAILANNTAVAEVPALYRENAAYYLIGVRPSSVGPSGRFHRLQVTVNRPNVVVRARPGYLEPTTAISAARTSDVESQPSLRSLLPETAVSLELCALPIGPEATGTNNNVGLVIRARVPRGPAAGDERLSISYSVLDMGGRERDSGRRDFTITPGERPSESAIVETTALSHLPPGRYDVRIRALGATSGSRGELIGDVTVPDFRKETLSASAILVVEPASPPMPSASALTGVLAGTPTISRVFQHTERVSIQLRLFQGLKAVPAPVTVKASIIDAHDHSVVDITERVDGSRFANGPAEYRLDLPLSRLGVGTYLLRLDGSRPGAATVRRELRFDVQ